MSAPFSLASRCKVAHGTRSVRRNALLRCSSANRRLGNHCAAVELAETESAQPTTNLVICQCLGNNPQSASTNRDTNGFEISSSLRGRATPLKLAGGYSGMLLNKFIGPLPNSFPGSRFVNCFRVTSIVTSGEK